MEDGSPGLFFKMIMQQFQDQITHKKPIKGESNKLSNIKKTISEYQKNIDKVGSFDSELSLVKKKYYDLNIWLPNPYYIGFRNQDIEIKCSEVLMTSRLDGANAKGSLKNNFTFWKPIHPALLRCETSAYAR
jgi:hypothetical protein